MVHVLNVLYCTVSDCTSVMFCTVHRKIKCSTVADVQYSKFGTIGGGGDPLFYVKVVDTFFDPLDCLTCQRE